MHIKNLHCMIEDLVSCAKHEVDKGIELLDTKEMGEVVDIIKDLCEAEYYAKISVAMEEAEYGEDYDVNGPKDGKRGYVKPHYHMTPDMYKKHGPEYWRDMDRHEGRMYYTETGHGMNNVRDHREGRSGVARRGYMETKEARPGTTPEDKQVKAKELEKYMNELSADITEMISGASNEEKTMLKTKMQALLSKI